MNQSFQLKDKLSLLLSRHHLMVVYALVFMLLLSGVITVSGTTYVSQLGLYFGAFILFYLLIVRYFPTVSIAENRTNYFDRFKFLVDIKWLVLISLLGVFIHLLILKRFPAIEAWNTYRLSEVVKIRRSITEGQSSLINYLMSWNLKAIIPFTLAILMLKKERRLYWLFFFIACGYAFILMQKSFILLVLMPAGVIGLFKREWLLVVKFALVGVSVVFLLTYIQNVSMRGGINDIRLDYEPEPVSTVTLFGRLFGGIQNRVMIIPGKTVVHWFELIPSKKPFLNGNGFKLFSKVSGGTYHNYAKELYPYVYPENAKHGILGSVNVASFMRGYSNFGTIGLLLSAFLLALTICIIESVFKGPLVYSLAFNAFPILMLSSGSLLTLLFSGGWMVTILLFLLFRSQIFQYS
jgi:hypothetical protein